MQSATLTSGHIYASYSYQDGIISVYIIDNQHQQQMKKYDINELGFKFEDVAKYLKAYSNRTVTVNDDHLVYIDILDGYAKKMSIDEVSIKGRVKPAFSLDGEVQNVCERASLSSGVACILADKVSEVIGARYGLGTYDERLGYNYHFAMYDAPDVVLKINIYGKYTFYADDIVLHLSDKFKSDKYSHLRSISRRHVSLIDFWSVLSYI